jgi:hypothetical protein
MTTTNAPGKVGGMLNLAGSLIYLFQVMQLNFNMEFNDLQLW